MEQRKPLITYDGDENLFKNLEAGLTESLSEEAIEWKRSYGRLPKKVYVSAKFVKFSEDLLKPDNFSLLGQAMFHTYWTDCSDLETYRSGVKDNIGLWLFKLQARQVQDWLVVVVDSSEARRPNKAKLLPGRGSSVLDRIKADFAGKASDKCISLLDPCRHDGRALESWQSLLQRLRQLVLQAYSSRLEIFEEHMRTQRERRTEPGWQFHSFFCLQEELAFVLEMLGLYDEALVQYDELDALFTQSVINSLVGGMPEWMSEFTQPSKTWSGICLDKKKAYDLQDSLKSGDICLLDFRNYLFSQQCRLLLLLCRPWEVTERSLAFLHNCVNELRILEVEMPVGSVKCWLFLSCLEVLQTCEQFTDSAHMETYSLATASLWSYAREKLMELGRLCGLLPGVAPTSEHLHLVVSLLSGIEDDDIPPAGDQEQRPSPKTKLREALNSRDSFLKQYFEISELTMGTYKHIGRIRMARYIGKDLAEMYMRLGQPHKAAAFLRDLLGKVRGEGWEELSAGVLQDLVECYSAAGDSAQLAKCCARLASSPALPLSQRSHFFCQMLKAKGSLPEGQEAVRVGAEHILRVRGARLEGSGPMTRGSTAVLEVELESQLPQPLQCGGVRVAVRPAEPQGPQSRLSSVVNRSPDGSQTLSAGLWYPNLHSSLQRNDSGLQQPAADLHFSTGPVEVAPGPNVLHLSAQVQNAGHFAASQLQVQWDQIELVLPHLPQRLDFTVVEEPPSLVLLTSHDLLAGVEQKVELQLSVGSHRLTADSAVSLNSTLGLLLLEESSGQWVRELPLHLPELPPFSTTTLGVRVLAELRPQRDIQHRLSLTGWNPDLAPVALHLQPPFLSQHKLHTLDTSKYLQVVVHGLSPTLFLLQKPQLSSSDLPQASLVLLNPPEEQLDVNSELVASYLWQIPMSQDAPPLKFSFHLEYRLADDAKPDSWRPFRCDIRLTNYTTLYSVKVQVEPSKGSEFCRAGTMCQMQLCIQQLSAQPAVASLMYEVVGDQTLWAVCGRTAGVVSLDPSGRYTMALDAMPLVGGYLPLPTVRLSKYIPGDPTKASEGGVSQRAQSLARLEPFDPGQVYSWSRALQVYVLPATSAIDIAAL